MSEFSIPHTAPIRFVKHLVSTTAQRASVEVGFETIPTLGMLVEAAAQSSSGITSNDTQTKVGFLVTLKNIKLLQTPKNREYQVEISIDYKTQELMFLTFSILDSTILIATGSLVINTPNNL